MHERKEDKKLEHVSFFYPILSGRLINCMTHDQLRVMTKADKRTYAWKSRLLYGENLAW